MGKQQFVCDLVDGSRVSACFCVMQQQQSNGKTPHKMLLRDRTGDIGAILWPSTPGVTWEEIAAARYADVAGLVRRSQYTQANEVVVERFAAVQQPTCLEDYLPTTPENRQLLWQGVRSRVERIHTPSLKGLLKAVFRNDKLKQQFREAPAAQSLHHAYIGGLMEHSLEVADLCLAVAQIVPGLHADLLVSAALLHDIGKTQEIDYRSPQFCLTRTGGMLGHVFMGAELVRAACAEVPNCPEGLADVICHLMLSHHGKLEWGAPVEPCLPEADVLHACDQLSARAFQFRSALAASGASQLFERIGSLNLRVFKGDLPWRIAEPVPLAAAAARCEGEDTPALRLVGGGSSQPFVVLPLVGSVAAGVPTDATQEVEARYPVPASLAAKAGDYLLRVSGDSMVEAHILDGDVVHVRPGEAVSTGDVVVALVDGETTVKYLVDGPEGCLLRPANPRYADIQPAGELSIQGKVVGLLRGLL